MQILGRLIRVRGETIGMDFHTWFSFDETFPVPEDCTTRGMQTTFQDGSLHVTFLKKNITQIGSKRKQGEPTQQTLSSSKPMGGEDNRYFIPLKAPPSIISTPDEEQRDPTAASTSGDDSKRVKVPRKLKSQMGEDQNKVMNREISITKGKRSRKGLGKTMEAVTKPKSGGQDENTKNLGGDKIQNPGGKINTEAESSKKPDLSNKPAEAEKDGEKYEGVKNNGTRKDEGSKNNAVGGSNLFVSSSIGVAALVIVALGAQYIYSFSRKPKKQNQ